MLTSEIQEDLLGSIKLELEKSDNLQKIQEIIKQIADNFLKPFKYITLLVIVIILITFMMTSINIYLCWSNYRRLH